MFRVTAAARFFLGFLAFRLLFGLLFSLFRLAFAFGFGFLFPFSVLSRGCFLCFFGRFSFFLFAVLLSGYLIISSLFYFAGMLSLFS